ncbi:MAG: helix-turn-helix domain-containing protein [Erysipelotrichaceae bacterium]|nr:helix-turn-helix domain-containing protein [Erysipelotrichaceae bacterium]
MSLGSRIRSLREEKKMTQEKLGEKLNVSFQAVSSWERDEYLPDTAKLFALAKEFDVSLSYLTEERVYNFKTTDALYDWTHMKTFIKTTAKSLKMADTLKAVDFAEKAHKDVPRKNTDIPYFYHPLNVACHALALGFHDDALVAACLLHDVVEDTEYTLEDLPVGEEAKDLVARMTKQKNSPDKAKMLERYFAGLRENPKAALIKCLDRCNNLTTMSWGFSRSRICEYIEETERDILPLLDVLKKTPEYNDAAWLLGYQMKSMLDIYKRML